MNKSIKIIDIAKKNLKRKFFRSIAIALSVMIVAGALFTITTVMEAVERSLKKGTERLGADIIVVPASAESKAMAALLSGEPSTFYMNRNIEDMVRNVKGVRSISSQLYLETARYRCCDEDDLLLIGFEPKSDFTIIPWLTNELKKHLSSDEVVMGRAITAYEIGSQVKLYGEEFKIVGMLEETGMKFIDNSIFLPFEALRKIIEGSKREDVQTVKIPKDQISNVLVQVDPEISPARVAIYIENEIPDVKAIVSEQVISNVRKQLFILIRSILLIIIILWIMALLLIGVVFSMIVNERLREIGLLRAMGAKRKNIFSIIMSEASLLSIAGGFLGILGGGVFLYLFRGFIRSSLNIPYLWPTVFEFVFLIVICLILAFITGTGAALYPALKSMRMEPYEAIRKGE